MIVNLLTNEIVAPVLFAACAAIFITPVFVVVWLLDRIGKRPKSRIAFRSDPAETIIDAPCRVLRRDEADVFESRLALRESLSIPDSQN